MAQMLGGEGEVGFLGRLAILLFGSRSQEPGAGSSSGLGLGFFYKLFSEGYY